MASNSGSFLICIPRGSDMHIRTHERFRTVGRAVVKMAEMLGADIEVSQKRNLLSVWVYYKNHRREWNPIYFDWGKNWSEKEVFSSIRSELYHLFPHHASLVQQSTRLK